MGNEVKDLNYFVKPGNIFVSWKKYQVATVLGSCVAICLSDPVSKVSGMNIFAFPKKKTNMSETYCGNYAIPKLLDMMVDMGAKKKNIQAHIVGGSYSKNFLSKDVGRENAKFAKKFLEKNKIEIVNNDTGGPFGRKVLFDTENGEIIVYKARNIREKDWYDYKSINHR